MSGLVLTAALALAAGLIFTGLVPLAGTAPPAVALPPFSPLETTTPQADGSVPARTVTIFGATPTEAGAPGSDETWGVGTLGQASVLVRYYEHSTGTGEEGSWTLGPALPSEFTPASGPLAATITPTGSGAMLGTVKAAGVTREATLVRAPGGAFQATAAVPTEGETTLKTGEEPLLKKDERLYGTHRAPLLAALAETDGQAGALVVPVIETEEDAAEDQVLHWDGEKWSSEPIDIPTQSAHDFRVLAIAASSPTNAWLLAQLARSGYPEGAVALFRRVEESAGRWSWEPVASNGGAGGTEAQPLTVPVQSGEPQPFTVTGLGEPPTVKSQLLTVTGEGVWIDGRRTDVRQAEAASTTLFFKPAGTTGTSVSASWCQAAPEGRPSCTYELPEALPSTSSYARSFAWEDPGEPYGQRVITGLREGISLRLEGDTFKRVLALGAGSSASQDPGAELGAAFSTPTEGWLGEALLPVHITEKPAASRLQPWPTPFRAPLLAVAAEPGAPVGALSSEALAVGLNGAVARYKPGQGWLPESLFGPGERVEREVQLRAVAWPRPTRAYAVGDHGQMWLWRAETGLWEKDPATPLNFRGNLVGIAFDPENPTIGYAIGTNEVGVGGVLLRYGKTWTQETSLPAQVQGAAFTSIAFAGSEAIVAYRRQPNPEVQSFEGGLLINRGSGWEVDTEAGLGAGLPRTVAGLPDGGAAVLMEGEVDQLYERESASSNWQATAVPPPGDGSSLALFREGGALRAIVAGGAGANLTLQPPAPPGSPPDLYEPIGSENVGPETAVVLRQTASGWSDESHELDPVGQPEGGYHAYWDMPYRPDPVAAVLVDPTGSQGWAVGGNIAEKLALDTADIERYPAEGGTPAGESEEAQVALSPEVAPSDVTFAIGGHAECVNPCSARARAGVGPQVWLTSALALAHKLGVQAFMYTGPSMSEARVEARERTVPLSFAHELERTASILAAGGGSPPVYVAASPQDLDARPESEGTEATFREAFAGFPQTGLAANDEREQGCQDTVGCQTAYYSFVSGGAHPVQMIVLDESGEVDSAQLGWLERQLGEAAAQGRPALVVGSGDLDAQIAAGSARAAAVAQALVCDGASAYFYDSPEEDVKKPLRAVCGGNAEAIEAYGSGTLGYINVLKEEKSDFHGASGVLMAQVEFAGYKPGANHNRAPVAARLIPVIGELALEAKGGTLLRRSEAALFAGLARRPRAGGISLNNADDSEVDPYIPVPEECIGSECPIGLFPEYTFTSSNKEVGEFVKRNTAVANEPLAVLQNAEGKPEDDEPEPGAPALSEPQAGLFCAFNKGTTIVTIHAGGLSASLPVTVQAGSVRQPCGTVPLKNPPTVEQHVSATPPPAPAPTPTSAAPAGAPPPVPAPPPPPAPTPPAAPPVVARPPVRTPPPTLVPPVNAVALAAFVPPPLTPEANPTPPSGTAAVTSPVEAAQREEEDEEATESVSNQAVAYRTPEHEPSPLFVLGIVTLAAFAGASARRRPRRGRRDIRVAPATVTGSRAQRRLARRSRGMR